MTLNESTRQHGANFCAFQVLAMQLGHKEFVLNEEKGERSLKKFQFSMASLLTVKESLEKQLKGEIAEAEARIRQFEAQKHAVEVRLEEARAQHLEKIRQGCDARELTRNQIGFNALYEKITACEEKIQVATVERNRIQVALVEAMTERKMLEKLREKQWDLYREEQKKEEAANIDDFLSSRITRDRNRLPD